MRPSAPLRCLLATLLLGATAQSRAAEGEQNYILFCMGCHGAGAQGVPGKIPPLAHSLARFMKSEPGRQYVLRVPGVAGSALSDAQIAVVLNWLAQAYDPEDVHSDTPLFTESEVRAWRHTPLADASAIRRTVIGDLKKDGPAPPDVY